MYDMKFHNIVSSCRSSEIYFLDSYIAVARTLEVSYHTAQYPRLHVASVVTRRYSRQVGTLPFLAPSHWWKESDLLA